MWEGLRQGLAARERRALVRPREAAVLVPIVDDGGELRLVLTRRTDSLSSHRGHVAFPGGRIDPEDDGFLGAALREAREEIGLDPSQVEVIGAIDDFPTVTNDTTVTPVVARLGKTPAYVPNPHEVARVFEIPLAVLRRPESWEVYEVEHGGVRWPMYSCLWDGETLWGLSAYITLHLLDLMPGGAPFALPARPHL
jgi:8-oxo-dGTP pyrophosphatase MutT (NUDIX family)